MTSSELDQLANRVVEFLREREAVRLSPEEIGGFATVQDICEELDIYVGAWPAIKNHMLKRGIDICYLPGKDRGHFLGDKGEGITNYVYKAKIAEGWIKHRDACYEAIKHSSPQAKAWIERRFPKYLEEQSNHA